jgi:hypothetical protein
VHHMAQHLAHVHFRDEDYRYSCLHCSQTAWDSKQMMIHLKIYHNVYDASEPDIKRIFDCKQCNRVFNYYSNYEAHMTQVHPNSICKKKFSFQTLVEVPAGEVSQRAKKLRRHDSSSSINTVSLESTSAPS